jgi:DNA-binding SARP family transcriptional activator
METRWRIELLGGLRAVYADRVIARFRTHKTGALFAFLAYHCHRAHLREELIELLWPDGDPPAGRTSLRTALSWLRHQLEPAGVPAGAVLLADRSSVRLNPEAITTDVAGFQAAFQAANQAGGSAAQTGCLAQAVELYPGELLPGHFDDWVLQERQWLSERYFVALSELLARLTAAHDLERALVFARQGVRADPLREEAHHDLMRLLVAAEQPEAALRQHEKLARLMEEQLGAEPSPEVEAFAAEIRSQVQSAERTRPKFAPPRAAPAPLGNLPCGLTRFFGRKPEIARLRALLQTKGTRLVTLTGPGGSGKTRLALETVDRLRKVWPGGIWFVPLQDLADPQLIPTTVLAALRVPRSGPVEPLEQLVTVLSGQPRLLVLDNFEHLVCGGASFVRTLLERVAPLTVLVTSRQRLGLPGERQIVVPPLPVPGVQVFRYSGVQDPRLMDTVLPDLNTRAPEYLNTVMVQVG